MLDLHHIALCGLESFINHDPVSYAHHLGSRRGRIVYTGMRPDFSGYGMSPAVCKAGTDSRVAQRRTEEGLAHTLPFLVPVIIAAAVIKPVRLVNLVSMRELSVQDTLYIEYLSVAFGLLIYGLERVPFLKTEEVNAPCVYVRKRDCQQGRSTGIYYILPQGVLYIHLHIAYRIDYILVLHPDRQGVAESKDHIGSIVLLIHDLSQGVRFPGQIVSMIVIAHLHLPHVKDPF